MKTSNSQGNILIHQKSEASTFQNRIGFPRLIVAFACWLPLCLSTPGRYFRPPSSTVVSGILIYGYPLAFCIGTSCFITAMGLWRYKRWALWSGMIYDGILVSWIVGYLFAAHFLIIPQHGSLFTLILLLAFDLFYWLIPVKEGLYLLSSVTKLRSHRIAFITTALTILLVVSCFSFNSGLQKISELRPLTDYVHTHWIDHTKNVGLVYDGGHNLRTRVYGSILNDFWLITPTCVEKNDWVFTGCDNLLHRHRAIRLHPSSLYTSRVYTEYRAQNILKEVGVSDPDLCAIGIKHIWAEAGYCYWSPKANGTFIVYTKDGSVDLFLQKNVKISKKED